MPEQKRFRSQNNSPQKKKTGGHHSQNNYSPQRKSPPEKKPNPELKAARREEQKKNEAAKAVIAEFLKSFGLEGMIARGRGLHRKFVVHCGPTNSGKTYDSIQKLKQSKTGLYLGPLRLLALEMFDTINSAGIPCSLLTGEERIDVPHSEITASTVEMCDFSKHYDTVVIDEAQLIADKDRGGAWTKALLLVDASEVHVCVAPEAVDIIISLIKQMNSPYELISHKRLTPLVFSGTIDSIKDVQPGDCLIAFSRKKVLGIAAALENLHIKASCIYGALPPASRREEVRRFTAGESTVVVATDAIGMGVSLPIKRIIFVEAQKFDGEKVRQLTPGEIRQIAGRAGRFGIYDKGEVLAMVNPYLIKCGMEVLPKSVEAISIPFPSDAIASDYAIRKMLEVWQKMPQEEGIQRADMTDALFLYNIIQPYEKKIGRENTYLYITRGVDTKQPMVVSYWTECCKNLMDGRPLRAPYLPESDLTFLEQEYKCLDVMHEMGQFQEGFEDNTQMLKERVSEKINAVLKSDKAKFLLRCTSCGRPLPITHKYGICDQCHKEHQAFSYGFSFDQYFAEYDFGKKKKRHK